MTRQKWTTKEQERWLEDRKPAFLIANQNKVAAKEFFPSVIKEFRDKWPVPPVTQEDIKDAGNAELAARVKKTKYDKVRPSVLQPKMKLRISAAHDIVVSQQYS